MSEKFLDIKFADPSQEATVEEMRQLLAKQFGVTVVGQFVTVRWYDPRNDPRWNRTLRQVTMVVTDVDDGTPSQQDE